MLFKTSTTITTDGSGDATVYLVGNLRGFVVAFKYSPGTIATGASLTITGDTSATPIMTKTSAGTSDVWYYPRALMNEVADGAAGSAGTELIPIVDEQIKVVVASGGATKTGTIEVIHYQD